jgi:hypothetical protein
MSTTLCISIVIVIVSSASASSAYTTTSSTNGGGGSGGGTVNRICIVHRWRWWRCGYHRHHHLRLRQRECLAHCIVRLLHHPLLMSHEGSLPPRLRFRLLIGLSHFRLHLLRHR